MAITFITALPEDKTLMAYNNNVIRFESDSVLVKVNAKITIAGQEVFVYSLPDGKFYFNFKEYVTGLVNQNQFIDTVDPELIAGTPTSFTYLGSGFYLVPVTVTIYYVNSTNESTYLNLFFLNGVEQLETYKKNIAQTGDNIILQQLYGKASNKYYAKYWEGYPFDISFLQIDPEDLAITNTTNTLDYTFEQKGYITRLFFCDGSTDETISDLLSIALGLNVLLWQSKYLYLVKEDVTCGVYFKWLNQYGGYSYWLFPKFDQRSLTLKSMGEINKDYDNLDVTTGQSNQIGMSAGEKLLVNSDKLLNEEFDLLRTILLSPKVYMFIGEPFAKAEPTDWLDVRVSTTKQLTRNTQGLNLDISLEVELPDYYTQTL